MAKTAAERAKAYRDGKRERDAQNVTKRDAVTAESVTNTERDASTMESVTALHRAIAATDNFHINPEAPADWLDRISSLPVGVVKPTQSATGILHCLTNQQLQSSLPRTEWQHTQAYAEVVYRLLYWAKDKLDFIPCWREAMPDPKQEAIPC